MTRVGFKPIVPKNLPQTKDYMQAIDRGFNKTNNAAKRDYEATTKTWDHKPQFTITIQQSGDDKESTIGTDDKVFGYVDEGTVPHIIRPRRARFLAFKLGGRPKTRVGIIGSTAGAAGTESVVAQSVKHPGFPGRKFSEAIQKRRQKMLEQETSQNIAKVARKQA